MNNFNSNNWAQIITEEYGCEDKSKLSWVAEYAHNHEIHESFAGVNGGAASAGFDGGANGAHPMYQTPLNTMGMGNPAAPQDMPLGYHGFDVQNPSFKAGSGDIPMSTLPIALNVALYTVGLELVPVVPSKGPWQMLSYMDFPYAGGKLGRVNETTFDGINPDTPLFVKVNVEVIGKENIPELKAALKALAGTRTENGEVAHAAAGDVALDSIEVELGEGFKGYFAGISRLDGQVIVNIDPTLGAELPEGKSLQEAIGEENKIDFVSSVAEFIDGYANFFDKASFADPKPMTRAENETGTGNNLGLRLFSKWIQMGSYEVTGAVTRQQLQDLPLYGVDAVAKVMEAMQNELTQHINAEILRALWKLGDQNHAQQEAHSGVNLDLKFESATGGTDWENTTVRQRRLATRILAAANLINVTGRRGRANWALMSAKLATALQDCSMFSWAPMKNTMVQDTNSVYSFGTLAGIKIYVDPFMEWNDNRVLVGRKGDANSPGLVFMPYILADTVTITAEGTMAPKMLINSRFAVTPIGFYPQLMYYSFEVKDSMDGDESMSYLI